MKNISLNSLTLSHVLGSSPILSTRSKIEVDRIRYFQSSAKFLYSTQRINAKISNGCFENIQNSIVTVNSQWVNSKNFSEVLSIEDDHLSIQQCRFKSINSRNGCIVFKCNKDNSYFTLRHTSFYECYASAGSVITSLSTNSATFHGVCVENCGSMQGKGSMISAFIAHQFKSSEFAFSLLKSTDCADVIIVQAPELEVKESNFSHIQHRGSLIVASCANSAQIYEIYMCNFEILDTDNTLSFENAVEARISSANFIGGTPGGSVIHLSSVRLCTISISGFFNLESQIVNKTGINSYSDFNACYFDVNSSKHLNKYEHLDMCHVNYTGHIPSLRLEIDLPMCWSDQSVSKRSESTILSVIKIIVTFIIVLIVAACVVRAVRLYLTRDDAGREVLERLNVFEGEENPQIKMMLMEAREGGERPERERRNSFVDAPDDIHIDVPESGDDYPRNSIPGTESAEEL